jgi:hypothetical protein
MTSLAGLPPIDVYKIGDVYFVQDGNHRVSVARQSGATHIQAYVTELHTKVPISPDDRMDDLRVSVPGQYQELEEHITVHRYLMEIERDEPIPYEEAVAQWYDLIYLPVVQIIQEQDLLHDFPDRTEADLYLWILEHRAELAKALDREVETEAAAEDLVNRFRPTVKRVFARALEKIQNTIKPE